MFSPNQQIPIHANMLNVQLPSPITNYAEASSSPVLVNGVANTPSSHAESLVYSSKKLENELVLLGENIKYHEENIKTLKTHINNLDDQITDIQVTLGKHYSSSSSMIEDEDEKSTVKQIMQKEESVAGIVCKLKYRTDPPSFTNDVLGVVATLGKVSDDNLSRLLSEYLGEETMLSLVCTTYNGVEALETYDKQGLLTKNSKRYNVICLENLRPYVGEFLADDPQRRLALVNPKSPNGDSPSGFLGFAVNMFHFDTPHLSSLTNDGFGIRETLFYNLYSRLQVYKTRAEMLQALPFIGDGAISLDGAIIKNNGVFVYGNREEMDVKFAVRSYLAENLIENEKKMKTLKVKKETIIEDLQREETILINVKYNFQVKKQEFVRFMAQSSPYAMQYPVQATPRRSTPR